jgi:hypothetical protein
MDMVRFAWNRSCLKASCCRVLVMNGAVQEPLGFDLVLDLRLLAVDLRQLGPDLLLFLRQQVGPQGPVLLGNEGLDLVLPLGDEAKRHALDPAGGEAVANGRPEEGRDHVSDEAIHDAAGLLGAHLVHVDLLG